MRLTKWIPCLLLVHFYCSSLSQTLRFKNYTTDNGLLSDDVYNLHQDKAGYLWVFTNYGVLKYNSSQFFPVLKNLPFSESFIYCIYENKNGQKWVANSHDKIYKIINDSAFQVKGTEQVSEELNEELSEITKLYVDDSLNIYAVTKRRSYKFTHSKDTYIPTNLSYQIKNDSVSFIILKRDEALLPVFNIKDHHTNFWTNVKGRSGMLIPSLESGDYRYYDFALNGRGALKTIRRFNKTIYFSQYDRLVKVSGNKLTYIPIHAFVNTFVKDKNDHTWVACLKDGIYELDERDSVINHYLKNITINDILFDSQNGLFASSTEHGLFHCENLDDLYFDENDSLAKPLSLIKLVDEKLFIATAKGEFFSVVNGKPVFLTYEKELGTPLNVYKHGSNYLLSFVFGIIEVSIDSQNNSKIVHPATDEKLVNVLKIIEARGDSLVYLGRKGIGSILNQDVVKRTDFNLKTFDCIKRGNNYVLATDKGIYIRAINAGYKTLKSEGTFPIFYDSLIQPKFLSPSKNSLIRTIIEDSLQRLWFSSTGNGIFLLDAKNNLLHITTSNGLPSNIVHSISFTSDNKILLCTNEGLFVSSPKNLANIAFIWNKIYPGEIRDAVVFKNKIYLRTKNGLVILNYNKINEKNGLVLNLGSVSLNSKQVDPASLKDLAYNQNNIDFEFDVIRFSEDRPILKYYLSGPVTDSGFIANNSIKFLNLTSGNYILSVYPEIYKGENLKVTIPFNIVPAWWQTIYFYISVIILSVFILYLTFLMIQKNVRRKRERKQKAERLIQEYRLIALKAQINPHFISNCLSAIQLLIIDKKVTVASKYIAKFGFLVRQILNFSTRSVITVEEEIELVTLNVELEQLRFDNRFSFEVIIDEKIEQKSIYVPALILNPMVENAIWHGLLPLGNTREGKLVVEVKISDGMLQLIVEDSGIGRNQSKQRIGNNKQSKGIQITEQRLGNINYLYNINSATISYVDLYNNEKNSLGTRVVISLPLNMAPLQNE